MSEGKEMQTPYLDAVAEPIIASQSQVRETVARRAANGYLSRSVGISFGAIAGVYVPVAAAIWQFAIEFRLPKLGQLGIMGTLDVDAETSEPCPLSSTEIRKIQDRANAIVQFYTQKTAA